MGLNKKYDNDDDNKSEEKNPVLFCTNWMLQILQERQKNDDDEDWKKNEKK